MTLRAPTALVLLLVATVLSCTQPEAPRAVQGVLDLGDWNWQNGVVPLRGEWAFGAGYRAVPDVWTNSEGGQTAGQGSGRYRLKILLPEGSGPLAVRYRTAATALAISVGGNELVRVGNPDHDPRKAVPRYDPGTVRVEAGPALELEIFVSNHEYRVGGLWSTPVLGPALAIEQGHWADQTAAVALAAALTAMGLSALLLFAYRRTEKAFLHLGVFSLLIALRSLATGEYPLVHVLPLLRFDHLIRLEYLSGFLILPSVLLFFNELFPRIVPRWGVRILTWPSWSFAILAVTLPLDLLTRAILGYYPIAVPTLLVGTALVVWRIGKDREGGLLLAGVATLATAGLADMATAAFLNTTGNLISWGLGIFVALQATTLAKRFLAAFEKAEALLAEKDLLIQEVHHRVKNSLQVVASLVSLQSNRLNDPAQKEIFAALRQRITAISLVHEKLYGQARGGRPDLGEYLLELLQLQFPRDGLGAGNVSWKVHADPVVAGVDYCIDAGLILTELVANAHKHGLAPRGGGQLEVEIRIEEGRLRIDVADDGPGFSSDFRPEASAGLGFRLVLALLQRNEGTLKLTPGPGARVRIELKLPSMSQ